MADPTDYLECSGAIDASGAAAAYVIPAGTRRVFITSDNAATTVSVGAAGDEFLVGTGIYELADRNLAGHTLYFDDGGNAYVLSQKGLLS